MNVRSLLAFASLTLVATACASGGTSASRSAQGAPPPPVAETAAAATVSATSEASAPATRSRVRRNANAISAQEVREAAHGNVFDMVSALRPEWLTGRGGSSLLGSQAVIVYLDHTRLGPAAALRQIQTSQVKSIQFFPGTEAQGRFGHGHSNGVIQVLTGR